MTTTPIAEDYADIAARLGAIKEGKTLPMCRACQDVGWTLAYGFMMVAYVPCATCKNPHHKAMP